MKALGLGCLVIAMLAISALLDRDSGVAIWKELREDLRKELMRQTSPSVAAHTILVHPKAKLVHVLTLGRAANELVRLHFADTFEADLLPLTPWQRSLELLETAARDGEDLRPGLQDLRRTDFCRFSTTGDEASRISAPQCAR